MSFREIYSRLKSWKRGSNESFSSVVKRVLLNLSSRAIAVILKVFPTFALRFFNHNLMCRRFSFAVTSSELSADEFLTFDEDQASLARAAGLSVWKGKNAQHA